MAYQNIYYERSKNLMHLWDDERGYTTFPYRKYAYKKDPYGQYRSMYGDKLSKVGKWEKEEAEDLFEADVPETTRVLVDIYNEDLPSKGHRVMTFDIEVEMITGLPNTREAQNEITAIAAQDSATKLFDVFVLDKQKKEGISSDDIALQNNDKIGRAGVERFYDAWLRGKPGVKVLAVDKASNIKGVVSETEPEAGKYVVLNIDAKLQSLVEEQLAAAIARARSKNYIGESGAAVVVDVTNGHVLAMATYPSYDPRIWLGGISNEQFQTLSDPKAGIPLISRATQGLFAPASIFKIVSTAAAAENGFDLNDTYQCPPQLEIGNRIFRNYESLGFGAISMQRALEVSCDTVFYDIANKLFIRG